MLGFRRTCCYGNAGCSSPRAGPHSQACEVRRSTQLLRLHRLLGLQWGHAWWGARGRSPPTFHAGTTFHKSTSSSPTGAGSGPRRLSSLPCFLLVGQKTSIKAWRSDGGALTDPHLRMPLLPRVTSDLSDALPRSACSLPPNRTRPAWCVSVDGVSPD